MGQVGRVRGGGGARRTYMWYPRPHSVQSHLRPFSTLVSKCPVTLKWRAIEWSRLKFGTQGYLKYVYEVSVYFVVFKVLLQILCEICKCTVVKQRAKDDGSLIIPGKLSFVFLHLIGLWFTFNNLWFIMGPIVISLRSRYVSLRKFVTFIIMQKPEKLSPFPVVLSGGYFS